MSDLFPVDEVFAVEQRYAREILETTVDQIKVISCAAEDIVQETFLRALEHADVLNDLDKHQCRAWLYKTARNLFIDRVRREAARPEAGVKEETEDDLSQIEVMQLCSELPEEERILFLKRYFEGYDSTQLSDMYGIPPSTVRYRLSSARRKLRLKYPELK